WPQCFGIREIHHFHLPPCKRALRVQCRGPSSTGRLTRPSIDYRKAPNLAALNFASDHAMWCGINQLANCPDSICDAQLHHMRGFMDTVQIVVRDIQGDGSAMATLAALLLESFDPTRGARDAAHNRAN